MSILTVEHLNKTFGGLQAVSDVSFSLAPGEMSAIIGPNGAGKSTLFNLITGYIRPDSGRVVLDNRDITGKPPHEIVRLGVGRSFQRSNIFPRLTAFENVQAAVFSHHRQGGHLWRSTSRFGKLNEQVERILESVGLLEKRNQLGGKLALGDQKRLEIGLALALEPKLMLLDEPTAGMSPEETANTVALINKLGREFNMTLLFTEHDMAVVFGISQTIRVLYYGGIIAAGAPQEISENPEVQRIYLGEKDAHSRFRG
jgi:branched-chain amino acid transport system ATP-binding protein